MDQLLIYIDQIAVALETTQNLVAELESGQSKLHTNNHLLKQECKIALDEVEKCLLIIDELQKIK